MVFLVIALNCYGLFWLKLMNTGFSALFLSMLVDNGPFPQMLGTIYRQAGETFFVACCRISFATSLSTRASCKRNATPSLKRENPQNKSRRGAGPTGACGKQARSHMLKTARAGEARDQRANAEKKGTSESVESSSHTVYSKGQSTGPCTLRAAANDLGPGVDVMVSGAI